MRIKNNTVTFHKHDMNFVKKFGVFEASEMVLDYVNTTHLPFIYDFYQLSHFFHLGRRRRFFNLIKNIDEHYNTISIPKKSGGVRTLSVPDGWLKQMQGIILCEILSKLPVSRYAKAYKKGSFLADNAAPHCGKKYLLKIDITDFFGSIRFDQIYKAAFNTAYFPKHIGTTITLVCCKNDVLPQGAPTSPALSNLVMKHFDDNFGSWCSKRGISYTRYCDDITLSSNTPLYTAYTKACSFLESMGFEINQKKTRFLTNASRQSVTGLTVNQKVSIPSDYKRNLRQEVYYVLKHGFKDSIIHSNKTDFIVDDEFVAVRTYFYHLSGKIKYVLQIEPHNKYFKRALFDLHLLFDKTTKGRRDIYYI